MGGWGVGGEGGRIRNIWVIRCSMISGSGGATDTETVQHIWWECPKYEGEREQFRTALGAFATSADPAERRMVNDVAN